MGRFKNVAKQFGVDLSSTLWNELQDTEKIRNCLLHANGRVSLFKDPKKITTIVEKKNSGLEIKKDRILISGEYLECFNKNISELMNKLSQNNAQP